jgi:uncharacterized protein
MREKRPEELSVGTCMDLLAQHHFGRVALTDDGVPVIFPVNYVLHEGDIFFRTGVGAKLDAALRAAPAAFEIDGLDAKRRVGWSVLARGIVREVSDDEDRDGLLALPIESEVAGEGSPLVRLETRSITGRRVPLSRSVPEAWLGAPDLGNIWYGVDGTDLLG